MTNQKKQNHQQLRQIVNEIFEYNFEEQLTLWFEYENEISFEKQTPDEISLIMLRKINFNE
jgi:hypothetical protein